MTVETPRPIRDPIAEALDVTTYAPIEVPQAGPGDLAVFSVGLGLLGMIAWLLPILGIPMTAIGLVLGWRARATPRRALAIAGMALCVAFLVLSVMNGGMNAYVGATGRQLVDPAVLKALLKQ